MYIQTGVYIAQLAHSDIIRIGMSLAEHTPRDITMRDAPAEQPVSPSDPRRETHSPCEPPHTAQTIPARDVHLYTIPNREYTGHYPNSQLFADVAKNPSLYMDRADF